MSSSGIKPLLLTSIIAIVLIGDAGAELCDRFKGILIGWLYRRILFRVPFVPALGETVDSHSKIWRNKAETELKAQLDELKKDPSIVAEFVLNDAERNEMLEFTLELAKVKLGWSTPAQLAVVLPPAFLDTPPESLEELKLNTGIMVLDAVQNQALAKVSSALMAKVEYNDNAQIMLNRALKEVKANWIPHLKLVGLAMDDVQATMEFAIGAIREKKKPTVPCSVPGWKTLREHVSTQFKKLGLAKKA